MYIYIYTYMYIYEYSVPSSLAFPSDVPSSPAFPWLVKRVWLRVWVLGSDAGMVFWIRFGLLPRRERRSQ